MPRKYERKPGVKPRDITWTQDSLVRAFKELDRKEKGINEISRIYGIPSRTLRRRYEKKNQEQMTKGKYPTLGFENEKKLVAQILELESTGIPPDRTEICQLAYQFAEELGLKHNFNKKTEMAGPQWLKSFLERNPEITLKDPKDLLRTNNRKTKPIHEVFVKNEAEEKPRNIVQNVTIQLLSADDPISD